MKKKFSTILVALAGVLTLVSCGEICDTTEELKPDEGSGSGTLVEDETHKDHTITFDGNEFVYVFDLPEEADTDEEVYFKLLASSGYSIEDVSVTYKGMVLQEVEQDPEDEDYDPEAEPEYEEVEGDIPIELNGSLRDGFTFVMPDEDVTVHAKGLGAYFNLWYDSDLVIFTSYNNDSRKMSAFWHGVYEPYTGTAISTGTNNYIQAGREVLVVAERPYTEENIVLYADGEPLEEVTDEEVNAGLFAFAFTMPAWDVEITATATSKYVDVILDTSDAIDGEGNEYLDAYLYTDDNTEAQLQKVEGRTIANSNDVTYVYAKVKEEYVDDISIDSVVLTWNRYTSNYASSISENSKDTSWSSTSTSTDTSGTAAKVDDNTKKFRIPSAYFSDDEIVVTFTLRDLTKYKDYPFVGTWAGRELSSGSMKTTNVTVTIDGAGYFTSATSNLNGFYITEVAEDLTCSISSSSSRCFYTDGKVAVIPYSTSQTDVWILANGVDTSNISFDTWRYNSSGNIWCVRIFDGEDCVGAVYGDYNYSVKFYAGVTIEFAEGVDSLASSNGAFNVTSRDGTTLRTGFTPEE